MREKDRFLKISKQKIKFSLRGRLTLVVAVVEICSIAIAYGITMLLGWLIPALRNVPFVVQLGLFSLGVVVLAMRLLSKIFFDPIKKVNGGMKHIAEGDFDVRLDTKSRALEIQEMMAGFNMMATELSSTEILKTDFISNVSHEIKTPINAIEGYSALLQGCDGLTKEQKEYIDKILFNTNRLSSLVSNILLLSKIENQTIQTDTDTYSLDEQIREAIVALEYVWEPKNIEFDVELEKAEYNGNEAMMRHVWYNLIGNAVKFSPKNSIVKIRLVHENESFVFTVDDMGQGLSETAKKHLFDKFYQADTSHKEEGNGLGLALVKRILSVEKGEIFAENLKDGGCRFTVILPQKT